MPRPESGFLSPDNLSLVRDLNPPDADEPDAAFAARAEAPRAVLVAAEAVRFLRTLRFCEPWAALVVNAHPTFDISDVTQKRCYAWVHLRSSLYLTPVVALPTADGLTAAAARRQPDRG